MLTSANRCLFSTADEKWCRIREHKQDGSIDYFEPFFGGQTVIAEQLKAAKAINPKGNFSVEHLHRPPVIASDDDTLAPEIVKPKRGRPRVKDK